MSDCSAKLSLGFSPCPNDTFIFHALIRGLTGRDCPGYAPEVLADVETLNGWALAAKLDVTKLSFHALGHVLDKYVLLMAGSALGRGCGPLLVAREKLAVEQLAGARVAIPGKLTTAAMLLSFFSPVPLTPVIMPFDRIMPSIVAGEVDAGVIIHESRFTFHQHGLQLVQDLGAWWEETTGFSIPLGGIVARRSLGKELISRIDACIRASVEYAFAEPRASLAYIRQHAQEMDEAVVQEHIGLYVNNYSVDLGGEGIASVREFLARGRAAGQFPAELAGLPLTSAEL
ncbi:MAG: 1,4-dihydroxy-6-naphthoate synthase [Desulfobulbaceae bacterium]|nr:1,4-dihydroxy-6-naphthoate synthase [Desulfobulbaceae bacterium]HIJ78860.1 1,4-dihydroxy-6-naphthoate synthase [Deltaproteobacteria bacterium]